MQLVLDLTGQSRRRLEVRAFPLGLTVEVLAPAAVAELFERPADDHAKAVERALAKNGASYKRLA